MTEEEFLKEFSNTLDEIIDIYIFDIQKKRPQTRDSFNFILENHRKQLTLDYHDTFEEMFSKNDMNCNLKVVEGAFSNQATASFNLHRKCFDIAADKHKTHITKVIRDSKNYGLYRQDQTIKVSSASQLILNPIDQRHVFSINNHLR